MAEQKGAAALGIGQHLAPADGGGIPEAQEGESRLGYHDAGAGQRGAHDKQMGDAGQDVAEHDMAPAGTGQLGRLDVVAVFEHQNLRAHNPGKACPAEDGEDENDHEIALAKEIGQHNGQRKGGDDEKDIQAFLTDICTPREICDLSQRLQVARYLDEGEPYVEVQARTGASSTTVSRVSKALNGEYGGYRKILIKLEDGE